MITLEQNNLVFRFPHVHEDAEFRIGFQRTLRIPNDDQTYPLPAGLGNFSLRHIDDFEARLPHAMLQRGGVILPMWPSEAMWINFGSHFSHRENYPFAVKIATGKINVITGKLWSPELSNDPQDYVVIPKQPWIDGYCIEKGVIRQFIAARMAEGHTVEEQISGEAKNGGIQIIAYPMKAEVYREQVMFAVVSKDVRCSISNEMGLAAGGKMRQEIYHDSYGIDAWDQSVSSRCFLTAINAESWQEVTGESTPSMPIRRQQYESAGVPWFDYYNPYLKPVQGSSILAQVKSIFSGTKGTLPSNSQVKSVGPSIRVVREHIPPSVENAPSKQKQIYLQDKLKDLSEALELIQKQIVEMSTVVAATETSIVKSVKKFPKGPKTVLKIAYGGRVFLKEHAADSLAECIRTIGVERVFPLGLKLGGQPLVSKSPPPEERGYRKIDGFFIATHASNPDKKVVLEEIADRLALVIKVEVLKSVH